jgi:hypothetical protein
MVLCPFIAAQVRVSMLAVALKPARGELFHGYIIIYEDSRCFHGGVRKVFA